MRIYYNPKLKKRAQELRKNATYSERFLWKHLKQNQLRYKFTRQKPIGEYIVDFYCPALKIVIEVDGDSHNFKEKYDKKREDYLKRIGLIVLRFNGNYIMKNINLVINTINETITNIEKSTTP